MSCLSCRDCRFFARASGYCFYHQQYVRTDLGVCADLDLWCGADFDDDYAGDHRVLAVLDNKISSYRKLRGLTQSELAQKVDCSPNAISAYENGDYCPSAYHAFLLCQALDVSFEDLFCLVVI